MADQLTEARTLIEVTMATISRVGEKLSFEERNGLLANLEDAGNRIRLMRHDRDSERLAAAMIAIDQIRQFLKQQQRH